MRAILSIIVLSLVLAVAATAATPSPDRPPAAMKLKTGPMRCVRYETAFVAGAWRLVCRDWRPGKQDARLVPRIFITHPEVVR